MENKRNYKYDPVEDTPEYLAIKDELEAKIRRDAVKLMTPQQKAAAKAAGRAVDVSADDFED